jgi:LysM repeat protein
MDQRTRKSPARFLAPLALIVVVVAALSIVTGNDSSDDASNRASDTGAQTTSKSAGNSKTTTKSTGTGTGTTVKATQRKTYTIKVGDTLGDIADREGVTVEQLQELNPDADPHNLIAGQKIRLR